MNHREWGINPCQACILFINPSFQLDNNIPPSLDTGEMCAAGTPATLHNQTYD